LNRARSFIFSTSLPPAVVGAGLAALDIVQSEEGRSLRLRLEQLRALVTQHLGPDICTGFDGNTPILPIITGEPQATVRASAWLQQQGIFLQGIRPPTVPEGSCRLRMTLMATHQPGELLQAADLIRKALSA
jgi:glycine C-acetyltransferase/8-amino-7-oxononanoate synthase